MAGAYAHLTLVNTLREPQRLEAIPGFPEKAIPSILNYFKYCELGAVSPDYPYLDVGNSHSEKWADTMHYPRTGQMIHSGIKQIRKMSGVQQQKCLVWLLGYCAHVGTDVTIHPMVNLKVGPYIDNKTDHRICEMNQDSYIFQRLNLGDIGLGKHLKSGITACSSEDGGLDDDIKSLWSNMLLDIHPQLAENNPPDLDKWHRRFRFIVENIAGSCSQLIPIARHIAAGVGLVYPDPEKIDYQFIRLLDTPNGKMSYDDVFDKAIENVGHLWALVIQGVFDLNTDYLSKIKDWNLDTGEDEHGELTLWL